MANRIISGFFFLFLCFPSLTLAESGNIKLGLGGPYSGEVASMGDDVKAGMSLAIRDINAKGGILNKKLVPLFEDDACDPKTGVAVANRFVTEKVQMATAFCSKVCMSSVSIYAEEDIPFLNECNTDSITTHGWPNAIRVYVKNGQEAPKLSQLIAKKARQHKLALLYFSEEYNTNLAKDTIALLDKTYHVTPNAVYELQESVSDFSSTITQLKDQKIDVVYLGFMPKAVGLFLRQAAAANYHPLFIGNLASSFEEITQIAGPLANGLIFTAPPDPQYIPSAASVVKAFAAQNIVNRPFAIYAYLLIQIYAEAVEKAGTTEGRAVLNILKTQTFPTIMGPLSFTKDGDMVGIDFTYFQWQNGKIVPFKGAP